MIEEMNENVLLVNTKFIEQKEYWIKKLSGEVGSTKILPQNNNMNRQKGTHKIGLFFSPDLAARLMKIANGVDLAIYMILLAGLKSLIYRYTSHENITVISPIYKINESEETINELLFIRDAVNDDMTFKELLNEIRQSVLEAYENQDYPFEKLIEYLFEPNTFISNILCSMRNIHDDMDPGLLAGKLFFSFLREQDEIKGEIQYDKSMFETNLIKQISRHFVAVLNESLQNIDIKISGISFFSEKEKEQLIYDFNDTGAEYPGEKLLHELFQEQAVKTPDNIAAVGPTSREATAARGQQNPRPLNLVQITYRELNKKANQFARVLIARGITTGSIAAIMADYSLEIPGAVLGTLKTGSLYLPLDLDYPPERKRYILKDSNVAVFLTTRDLFKRGGNDRAAGTGNQHYFDSGLDANHVIFIDNLEDESRGQHEAPSPPPRGASPHPLAYIIYTSGSTGKPKGVMVAHRSVVNYINWARKVYGRGQPDDFPLYSSLAFDLTVTSLYVPLLTGNKLVIYRQVEDEYLISRIIEENMVRVIKLTPTHLKILNNTNINITPGIKKLIVGGEELTTALAVEIYKKFGENIEIYNEYGPTETVVGCMVYQFDNRQTRTRSVSIGHPAENTQIYLLDKNLNPVPWGAVGEIVVSGVGVARGYLNQPQLTGEKFIPNPFLKGTIMYRTGDLARRMTDGNIELLGRKDYQVKIRGFRIELGEIESQLLKIDGIKDAVVEPKADSERSQYLCAFFVPQKKLDLNTSKIREDLAGRLPIYMIPSFFISMEKLPLTPNGKIDRKALPDPPEINPTGKNRYRAPRNIVEKRLVEIWEKILDRCPIGIDENFFVIGGNSIKAIQIAARMKKEGYQLELQELFTYQSIKEIAVHVKRTWTANQEEEPAAFDPAAGFTYNKLPGDVLNRLTKKYSLEDIYPLTPMQEGMLFHSLYDNSSSLFINQLSYRHYDEVDLSVVEQSINELIKRYDTLRTIFIYGGGEGVEKPLQLVLKERQINLHYEDISEKIAGSEKEQFIEKFKLQERQKQFDLSRDLLLRLTIIKLNQSEYETIWTHHCILMDGWSQSVMVLAFTEIYHSYLQGRQCQLSPVTPFRTYIKWLEKQDWNQSKKYWQKYLEGYDEIASVPKMPPSANKEAGFISEEVFIEFKKEKTRVLDQIARRNRVTLNIVFQVIWAIILAKYTGKNDVVFGNIVSGRPPGIEGIEAMVGLFTNMIPVRIRFRENTTFSQLLREIQQNKSKSEPHHYYPLVEIQAGCSMKQKLFDHFYVFGNFPVSDEQPLQEAVGSEEKVRKEFVSKLARVRGFEQTSYDLTIYITAQEASLIFMAYNAKVYRKDFMEKITLHIEEVIEKVIKNENIRVKDLEITSDLTAAPSRIFDGTQPDFDI